MNENILDRIIMDPKIMMGKPVIKDTQITAEHILGLLGQGMTIEEVLAEHKRLAREDVVACLLFAAEVIDAKWKKSRSSR